MGETGGGVGGGVGHVLAGSLLKYCCVFLLPPNCLTSPLSNFRRPEQPQSAMVEQVVPVSEHCPDTGEGAGLGFGTGTGLLVGLLVGFMVGLKES